MRKFFFKIVKKIWSIYYFYYAMIFFKIYFKFLPLSLRKNISKKSKANTILYLCASCMPYHTTGYTIRTDQILKALKLYTNKKIIVFTRPGYPWDRSDTEITINQKRKSTIYNNIIYRHIPYPRKQTRLLPYILQSSDVIFAKLSQIPVDYIIANSNHINALPGLIAAKKFNIPFIYEMRGLWELSRISRQPDFKDSILYKQGLALEQLVVKYSDKVTVISKQLSNYIQDQFNIASKKIKILPNCANSQKLKEVNLNNHIVYAGSLIKYEGIDLLLNAAALMKEKKFNYKVFIIGKGEESENLKKLSKYLNLKDRVYFLGHLSPKKTISIIHKCSVVCLPRKSYLVTKLVPPYKLIEAMNLKKVVVAPKLPVFLNEIKHKKNGLLFLPNNKQSLANTLMTALRNKKLLKMIANSAYVYAQNHRSWKTHIRNLQI
jgi:glycosyltransferase involved in cell wall biosynthesis